MPCTFNPSLSPPWGAEITPPGHLLSPGSSVWANFFCNDLEITCPKCRHPTKSIPVEQMWGGTFCPPPKGGTNSVFWSFLGRGRRSGLIPFAMSQIFLGTSLDTPQRVSKSRKCGGHFLPPPPYGGTHSVFWTFLSLGRSVWADSFCNESDIS